MFTTVLLLKNVYKSVIGLIFQLKEVLRFSFSLDFGKQVQ